MSHTAILSRAEIESMGPPLPEEIAAEVRDRNLVVASVLSGNRNFEGRIQQDVRANYLASPPLVVAYALTGSMNVDVTTEPYVYSDPDEYRLDPHGTLPYDWTRKDG